MDSLKITFSYANSGIYPSPPLFPVNTRSINKVEGDDRWSQRENVDDSGFVLIWANEMSEAHATAWQGQVWLLRKDSQYSNKLLWD